MATDFLLTEYPLLPSDQRPLPLIPCEKLADDAIRGAEKQGDHYNAKFSLMKRPRTVFLRLRSQNVERLQY